MSPTHLRFNFGYLLESPPGTSSDITIDYPKMRIEDVTLEPLTGQFTVTRTREGIYIGGRLQTNTPAECVRCLGDTIYPVDTEIAELFYYPASTAQEGEYCIDDDAVANLGPLVRELALLALPIQVLCREDCAGLCGECGHNLNEGACDCEIDDIDPRLAALKQLLN